MVVYNMIISISRGDRASIHNESRIEDPKNEAYTVGRKRFKSRSTED